ncbi:E3 ubiquitin-protein ligase TRIM56-like [Haliotis rubra]|uniref:E3 ubiquitin-protein ligase TRIM56-like n=1 Tax=Haliotis rubra TaxID=36100 RepID=UPI001EE5EB95|nr:E3 ubiquitin-protein ligase TRIM56-like [Haliotis rubra]XP_046579692.1 E3 ubiquitin-protein ligase TRIM56-like [Haliotis rubra]
MATSQAEKVREFLTCVICQELYTDPCTLRCDHTFCRKCVTAYIQTRPEAVQAKTIPCAFCRQDTKVPHPNQPVEEWSGQIKPSIIIQGLIDTQSESDKRDTAEQQCTLCSAIGETIPGTSWCQECEVTLCQRCAKIHHATPTSRDHEVADLSTGVTFKRKRKVMCTEHTAEALSLVCKDCRKAVCPTCCVVYHRKCESVFTIDSMKATMKYHLTKRRNTMTKKIEGKETVVQITKKKINSLEEKMEVAELDVQYSVEKAIEKIKQKEKELMREIREITDAESKEFQADVKREEIEIQMYRQHCEFIDQALVSDCEMDLYDAYQAWEDSGDVRNTDSAAGTRRVGDVKFTPDFDKISHLQLGKIDVTFEDEGQCLTPPVVVDKTDGRTESSGNHPCLGDVTVLVVDGIQTVVVTDWENNCVKSFYRRHNESCHSKLPLGGTPCGETQLKENKVMVAIPLACQIVTVEVNPDLHLLSTMTTSKGYYSIAVLNPASLAAGGDGCVDMLDMSGRVLRRVATTNKGRFVYPFFMSISNRGNMLVSDWGERSVTCMTPDGDVVWRYVPTDNMALKRPRGITTTSTGDVLLADLDSSRVIQLTESGKFVRNLLTLQDGIPCPSGVYVDRHDSLFVCTSDEIMELSFT